MRLAPTNGKLLDEHYDLVRDTAMVRLELLARANPQWVSSLTAGELVAHGLTDEVRVFVKNELHNEEKVRQGRMRIIMSISVIDQIVERVLHGGQNGVEISRWEHIPSKPGLGLHDEGLKSLEQQIARLHKPLSSDVSGFDWSVPQWALDWDADCRVALSGAGVLASAIRNRTKALSLSRLVYSDGLCWDQEVPGIQKSGSYNTSSTNSRIRFCLMLIAARRRGELGDGLSMGDDAVESCDDATRIVEVYASMGFKLKDPSRELEFCSYRFLGEGRFEPVRWHKMLAGLLSTVPRDADHANELLVALRYELRHSPYRDASMALIRAVGWGARN